MYWMQVIRPRSGSPRIRLLAIRAAMNNAKDRYQSGVSTPNGAIGRPRLSISTRAMQNSRSLSVKKIVGWRQDGNSASRTAAIMMVRSRRPGAARCVAGALIAAASGRRSP